MRLTAIVAIVVGLGVSLAGCINPDDMAQRAVAGGALGAGLGAGLGATFAINPALGASFGAATGGVLGAAAGAITTEPAVEYGPIPVRDTAARPSFYDEWPPGYQLLPLGAAAPPPLPRPG
ncbi:MAG: hypothetical protein JO267_08925 [Alphaproteobacteria bacterium]|nr:hypothetical protein [Alphaproteobacteria bacterium]